MKSEIQKALHNEFACFLHHMSARNCNCFTYCPRWLTGFELESLALSISTWIFLNILIAQFLGQLPKSVLVKLFHIKRHDVCFMDSEYRFYLRRICDPYGVYLSRFSFCVHPMSSAVQPHFYHKGSNLCNNDYS